MRNSIVCAALCSALLVIPGCGTAPPAPISPVVHTEIVEAKVQVPVACIDAVPQAPAFLSDADLLAAPNGSAVDRIWRDHLQRKQWEGQLEALIVACAGVKK
ncbi:hypothetical protein [Paraburkholderia sp. BL9I2N2]|uniref:hypothetical protein n=1 Tax=Paraburkholderia sp. BL9I2N2 TaxID=1938809 RepID=UPI001051AA7E|nr:hypothetical protein [Paraburkholderia sp. BL9I2N2]TCK96240.1 hypothetical protein B0G74_2900 [Paraburkholderia sp. BL9I2N2]